MLALALGLAHLLDDHLLGRLGRDPPQVDGRQLFDDELADLDFRLRHPRIGHADLGELVLDLVGHLAIAP